MTTRYEIPLEPVAQTFEIDLGGVTYGINLYWNEQASIWCIDILDANANPLVNGIPLVANQDLLQQYGYMSFGGQLVAQCDSNQLLPPDSSNLGSSGHLYFITTP